MEAHQASLSITNSRSSLRLTSIDSVIRSSHLILCRPFIFLPPILPSIRVFSNESTLRMRWPKYWSFSFSICFVLLWFFPEDSCHQLRPVDFIVNKDRVLPNPMGKVCARCFCLQPLEDNTSPTLSWGYPCGLSQEIQNANLEAGRLMRLLTQEQWGKNQWHRTK